MQSAKPWVSHGSEQEIFDEHVFSWREKVLLYSFHERHLKLINWQIYWGFILLVFDILTYNHGVLSFLRSTFQFFRKEKSLVHQSYFQIEAQVMAKTVQLIALAMKMIVMNWKSLSWTKPFRFDFSPLCLWLFYGLHNWDIGGISKIYTVFSSLLMWKTCQGLSHIDLLHWLTPIIVFLQNISTLKNGFSQTNW